MRSSPPTPRRAGCGSPGHRDLGRGGPRQRGALYDTFDERSAELLDGLEADGDDPAAAQVSDLHGRIDAYVTTVGEVRALDDAENNRTQPSWRCRWSPAAPPRPTTSPPRARRSRTTRESSCRRRRPTPRQPPAWSSARPPTSRTASTPWPTPASTRWSRWRSPCSPRCWPSPAHWRGAGGTDEEGVLAVELGERPHWSRRRRGVAGVVLALLASACASTSIPESLPGPVTTTTVSPPPAPVPQDPACTDGNVIQSLRPDAAAEEALDTRAFPRGFVHGRHPGAGPPASGSTRRRSSSSVNPQTGQVEGFDVEIARGDGGRAVRCGRRHRVRRHPLQRPGRRARRGHGRHGGGHVHDQLRARTASTSRPSTSRRRRSCSCASTTSPRASRTSRPAGACSRGLDQRRQPPGAPAGAPRVEVIDQADCLVLLQQGQVEGISTDDTILAGMQAQDPNVRIVGDAFSAEPYGIGLPPNHPEYVRFVNAALEQVRSSGGGLSCTTSGCPACLVPTSPRRPPTRTSAAGIRDPDDRSPHPGLEERPHDARQPARRPRVTGRRGRGAHRRPHRGDGRGLGRRRSRPGPCLGDVPGLDEVLDDVEADPARAAALLDLEGAGGGRRSSDPSTALTAASAAVDAAQEVAERLATAWASLAPRGRGSGRGGRGGDGPTEQAAAALAELVATDPFAVTEADVVGVEQAAAVSGNRKAAQQAAVSRSTSTSPPPATRSPPSPRTSMATADELAQRPPGWSAFAPACRCPTSTPSALARAHRGRRRPPARRRGSRRDRPGRLAGRGRRPPRRDRRRARSRSRRDAPARGGPGPVDRAPGQGGRPQARRAPGRGRGVDRR